MVYTNRHSENPLFSIIIPCKTIDADAIRCGNTCFSLRNNKEIFIVDDDDCPGLPATKRNWAMERAKGEYLAFIDSDAYPDTFWLDNALACLKGNVAAVCGPGLLPPNSSLLEQATDLVLKCMPYSYRVTRKKARFVSEFPTFNLIVRRDLAPKFKNYLTGEDSLFCRELPGLILYSPSVVVYHKRRPLFKPYWKQISTYGMNRGRLIRLALLGWISTWFVYPFNFIKGLFAEGAREEEDGEL